MALILSGAMMLDHLGEHDAADRVRDGGARGAARRARSSPATSGGTAGTTEIAEAIASRV